MRLTCPNCGAQYEVPAEVIPAEGRDVQCSNCGDTWFQAHPEAETAQAAEPEPQIPDPEPDDLRAALTGQKRPEPEPEPNYTDEVYDDEQDVYEDDDSEDVMPEITQEHGRGVDPSVASILKEEAAREADLRAGDGLESQPDLGLDDLPGDESTRRAKEAQDRMAVMKGEDPTKTDAPTDGSSRRGLLPDIEEINSTLRNGADQADGSATATAVAPGPAKRKRKGGFMRGLTVAILFGAMLTLIYVNAPQIAQSVPQADPMLSAYVALVDQARVWLDAQVAGLATQQ
ncbi:zinc-ribbon domain-containing protein [Tropicibacter sp. Alg240-R139]|uniref:zinc-ribbon domain-containing protein n=1 Tax=Tropicibacter sp. Alg240-R139 TaxID=2305991 RepID=UPI0013DF2F66|nr:zinc-ribbon domain-containing protein [Tropicibacter sp. Alg240-R139]